MGKEDKDKKEDKMPKEEKKEANPEAKKKKKKKRHTPRNYRLTKGTVFLIIVVRSSLTLTQGKYFSVTQGKI